MDSSNKKHQQNLRKVRNLLYKISTFLILGLVFFSLAQADFSSTNFILENPVNTIQGGQSASSSFQYFSSTGETSTGESSSTSFVSKVGSLFFPTATSPVVSATAGNDQVTLSWSAATGILANITSYELGVSTISGSGYTYSSMGSSLSTVKSSLNNNTRYYFIVRSYIAGVVVSQSAEVSATPVAPSNNDQGGGGGGGGGGGFVAPPANPGATSQLTTFSGRAYPSSTVVLLKDAQVLSSTVAGSDANFSIGVSNLNAGNYIFSVYSEDNQGNRSSLLTFPVSVTEGANTNIGGIFLAPTIAADKSQVKKGDNITFFGQSIPSSEITIAIHSEQEIFEKTNSDKNGVYLQVVDSTELELGDHTAKSKSAKDGQISSYSKVVAFAVGTTNSLADKTQVKSAMKSDLNGDKKVNLVDFSIQAFWYKKKSPPSNVDLNSDGKVDLADFSIMAFNWTG